MHRKTINAHKDKKCAKKSVARESHFNAFYKSEKWLNLRLKVIVQYGKRCMKCGLTRGEMHIDHIRPRSIYPEMEYSLDNLQILCRSCNLAKGAWDHTDWRPKKENAEIGNSENG